MVGGLPRDKRADAIRSCRRRIAVALQTGIANQIHSAGKPAALSDEVSYLTRQPLDAIIEEASATQEGERMSAEVERLTAQGRATGAAGG